MTARKDGSARKPREFGLNRFGGRYQPRSGGTGHRLDAAETKALLLEQLCDSVKPGTANKVAAADIYFTEAHDPPEEIERAMLNDVDPRYRTPYMMHAYRAMIRAYVRLQWGVRIPDGSGD